MVNVRNITLFNATILIIALNMSVQFASVPVKYNYCKRTEFTEW